MEVDYITILFRMFKMLLRSYVLLLMFEFIYGRRLWCRPFSMLSITNSIGHTFILFYSHTTVSVEAWSTNRLRGKHTRAYAERGNRVV